MKEGLQIRGDVEIGILRDGKLVEKEVIKNKIVNGGLERIAKLITGDSSADYGYIALGTGTTPATNSDTSLEIEVVREAADNDGAYEADYKAIFEHTFNFGSGVSHSITEAGVFDQLTESGSTMLDRFTFSTKNVDADNPLYIKITITLSRA